MNRKTYSNDAIYEDSSLFGNLILIDQHTASTIDVSPNTFTQIIIVSLLIATTILNATESLTTIQIRDR